MEIESLYFSSPISEFNTDLSTFLSTSTPAEIADAFSIIKNKRLLNHCILSSIIYTPLPSLLLIPQLNALCVREYGLLCQNAPSAFNSDITSRKLVDFIYKSNKSYLDIKTCISRLLTILFDPVFIKSSITRHRSICRNLMYFVRLVPKDEFNALFTREYMTSVGEYIECLNMNIRTRGFSSA